MADIIARGMAANANDRIDGITIGGAPYIQGDKWFVWDTASSSYKDSGINAEGQDGVGISTIEKTSTSGLEDTYTITFEDNRTTTFVVTNGEKGADGAQGKDGLPGTNGKDGTNATINGKEAIEIEAGNNITITDTVNGISISSTGGSGGTSDYNDLVNKPSINNIELDGNKTIDELGLASDEIIYISNDSTQAPEGSVIWVETDGTTADIYTKTQTNALIDAAIANVSALLGETGDISG